jgi:hypothetical protein
MGASVNWKSIIVLFMRGASRPAIGRDVIQLTGGVQENQSPAWPRGAPVAPIAVTRDSWRKSLAKSDPRSAQM